MDIIPVLLTVIISIVGLLIALRPWIKDVVRSEISRFKEGTQQDLSSVTERLALLEGRFQEWAPYTQRIAERLMEKPSNPNGRRQELLERWKEGTLTYEQALELRDILAREAMEAEEGKKDLANLALLALFIYAMSKAGKNRVTGR